MKMKRLKYLCLSFLILLSFLLGFSSYADKGLQGKGKGNAIQPGDSGKWENDKSGYRFTIVDNEFNPVYVNGNASIDIIFSMTGSDYKKYKNAKIMKESKVPLELVEGFNEEYLWKDTIEDMRLPSETSLPPFPMIWIDEQKSVKAQGELFNEWMNAEVTKDRTRADFLVNAKKNIRESNFFLF